LSQEPKAEDSSKALKSGSHFRLPRTLIVLGRVIIALVFKSRLLDFTFLFRFHTAFSNRNRIA
jgi:hypothetical protein